MSDKCPVRTLPRLTAWLALCPPMNVSFRDNDLMDVQFRPEEFAELIERAVTVAIARLDDERATLGDRLAFSEPEAAALIGLEPWQLRDERRRGRIQASQVVGRRIRYLRSDLLEYLMARRIQPK